MEAGSHGTVAVGKAGQLVELASILMTGSNIKLYSDIAASGGTIIFHGPVQLEEDITLIDRGPTGIIFADTVDSSGATARTLTLTAERGRVSFLGEVGASETLELLVTAASIELKNNVNVSGAFATTGPVSLLGDTRITARTISLLGTVDGAHSLNLASSPVGVITLTHTVGDTIKLKEFVITNFAMLSAQGIIADKIEQLGGTNASYNGFLHSTGKDGISLTGNTFFFDGFIKATGGGGFALDNAGAVTTGSNLEVALSGAFNQVGSGGVEFLGTIATEGQNIAFAAPLTLTGSLALDTGGGTGDVRFANTVDGSFPLSVNLQIGDLAFDSVVGSVSPLGTILIQSVRNVVAGDILAEGVVQLGGYGRSTYLGEVATTGSAGINITANYLEFAGALAGKTLSTAGGNHIIINAVYGGIGSDANPVRVDASSGEGNLFVGSGHPAYFESLGNDVKLLGAVRSNVPCFVEYNGVVYKPKEKPINVNAGE